VLSDKVKQFINFNVTGRVFMLCTSEGVKDPTEVRQYEQEIRNFVENAAVDIVDIKILEELMLEEMEFLRLRIRGEEPAKKGSVLSSQAKMITEDDTIAFEDMASHPDGEADLIGEEELNVDQPIEESIESAEIFEDPVKAEADKFKDTGYKTEVMEMEKKLVIGRKPIADFLTNECIAHHLITPKKAHEWVHKMPGRVKEEIEAEIVAELSLNLHQFAKKYIRKNKNNNPWSTPTLQNDLKMDIESVKTVRGVLILSDQIRQEIATYQENSRPSILKRLFKKNSKK